jgi:hypothetical protein
MLVSSSNPEVYVQTPYGTIDHASQRDSIFFRQDAPGELTPYARGFLFAVVILVAIRVLIVLLSVTIICVFSLRGSRRFQRCQMPFPPRPDTKEPQPRRDPSHALPPGRGWIVQETEFHWQWRERTRARIQDAFELCMIRKIPRSRLQAADHKTAFGSARSDMEKCSSIPVSYSEHSEAGSQKQLPIGPSPTRHGITPHSL